MNLALIIIIVIAVILAIFGGLNSALSWLLWVALIVGVIALIVFLFRVISGNRRTVIVAAPQADDAPPGSTDAVPDNRVAHGIRLFPEIGRSTSAEARLSARRARPSSRRHDPEWRSRAGDARRPSGRV